MKQFSQACENNKHAILDVLRVYLANEQQLLEVGSGTGQHAAHFAAELPHLVWQPGDLIVNFPSINAWRFESELDNCLAPLEIDLHYDEWLKYRADNIFTANTLHIVSWPLVQRFFSIAGQLLPGAGYLLIYGPFNYQGAYTSESNQRFDVWLKARDPMSGIRDFEAVQQLAIDAGLLLLRDHKMPANNRCLVFQKQ